MDAVKVTDVIGKISFEACLVGKISFLLPEVAHLRL